MSCLFLNRNPTDQPCLCVHAWLLVPPVQASCEHQLEFLLTHENAPQQLVQLEALMESRGCHGWGAELPLTDYEEFTGAKLLP